MQYSALTAATYATTGANFEVESSPRSALVTVLPCSIIHSQPPALALREHPLGMGALSLESVSCLFIEAALLGR